MFEVNGILYASSPKDLIKIQDAKVTGHMMMLLLFLRRKTSFRCRNTPRRSF